MWSQGRARELDVSEESLDDAEDEDDVKAAVTELCVEAKKAQGKQKGKRVPTPEPEPEPERAAPLPPFLRIPAPEPEPEPEPELEPSDDEIAPPADDDEDEDSEIDQEEVDRMMEEMDDAVAVSSQSICRCLSDLGIQFDETPSVACDV